VAHTLVAPSTTEWSRLETLRESRPVIAEGVDEWGLGVPKTESAVRNAPAAHARLRSENSLTDRATHPTQLL